VGHILRTDFCCLGTIVVTFPSALIILQKPAVLKNTSSRHVTSFSLVETYRRFRGTCCSIFSVVECTNQKIDYRFVRNIGKFLLEKTPSYPRREQSL
jgi:hypothetical protein